MYGRMVFALKIRFVLIEVSVAITLQVHSQNCDRFTSHLQTLRHYKTFS